MFPCPHKSNKSSMMPTSPWLYNSKKKRNSDREQSVTDVTTAIPTLLATTEDHQETFQSLFADKLKYDHQFRLAIYVQQTQGSTGHPTPEQMMHHQHTKKRPKVDHIFLPWEALCIHLPSRAR
jgi:hypothetical protein